MKKLFKKIAILVCIITLFTAPSNALASTSSPVLTYESDDVLEYQFLPNPYSLSPNLSHIFEDVRTSTDNWVIPAGKMFIFSIILTDSYGNVDPNAAVMVTVVKNNELYSQEIYTGSSATLNIEPDDSTTSYIIAVTALNNVNLYKYTIFLVD